MHIHHIANHQRRAFMPTQHTGGERPGDLHLADITGVYLVQRGVTLVVVGDRWHHYVRRVLLHLQQIVAAAGLGVRIANDQQG